MHVCLIYLIFWGSNLLSGKLIYFLRERALRERALWNAESGSRKNKQETRKCPTNHRTNFAQPTISLAFRPKKSICVQSVCVGGALFWLNNIRSCGWFVHFYPTPGRYGGVEAWRIWKLDQERVFLHPSWKHAADFDGVQLIMRTWPVHQQTSIDFGIPLP